MLSINDACRSEAANDCKVKREGWREDAKISRCRFKGSLELRVAFESGTDEERTENEERGALSVDKQEEGEGEEEHEEEEKEKDERSIVRLEYPPRRSCRDGREEEEGGREGEKRILIRVRRDTAKRARGGPGGRGRDTFVRLSPNSIGDE